MIKSLLFLLFFFDCVIAISLRAQKEDENKVLLTMPRGISYWDDGKGGKTGKFFIGERRIPAPMKLTPKNVLGELNKRDTGARTRQYGVERIPDPYDDRSIIVTEIDKAEKLDIDKRHGWLGEKKDNVICKNKKTGQPELCQQSAAEEVQKKDGTVLTGTKNIFSSMMSKIFG
eukprot:c13964_g1_i1.p1 GENE.c13964_g1_i1~~c13964_g1_i1.p1  ORF type:complete len:189 (-),score=69.57 c13964_g1_i1:56-574(-)